MNLPSKVNLLLLGNGGREHALAWKISRSARLSQLFIANGNCGTASCGTNVDLNPTSFASIKQFVISNNINLVVCGPEEPLVKGIYDYFKEDDQIRHIPVIGPSQVGAQLEGSKEFAKEFMKRNNIPTAAYQAFTKETLESGFAFLDKLKAPYVLKADGLAAGKGVVILENLEGAKSELADMLEGKFGASSKTVVIEEFLSGIECSVFVISDGNNYKILPVAKDYKRIGNNDQGLNTGGMGAVSPVPFADKEFMDKVEERIVKPTVEGLKNEKIEYKGFIFLGLINVEGEPMVIEYNVRMGDPETEVVMPRITSDIIDMFAAMAYGSLDKYTLTISDKTAATVVAVSGGYPEDYTKGIAINGLDDAEANGNSIVFHAGTTFADKQVVTDGGRVLAVTSLADSIAEATAESYNTLAKIQYEGKYHRTDIGKDLEKLL
ncbi:MAG: phosphoribosylamine--glycine ligase [Rikenellaceae bacterium]